MGGREMWARNTTTNDRSVGRSVHSLVAHSRSPTSSAVALQPPATAAAPRGGLRQISKDKEMK